MYDLKVGRIREALSLRRARCQPLEDGPCKFSKVTDLGHVFVSMSEDYQAKNTLIHNEEPEYLYATLKSIYTKLE